MPLGHSRARDGPQWSSSPVVPANVLGTSSGGTSESEFLEGSRHAMRRFRCFPTNISRTGVVDSVESQQNGLILASSIFQDAHLVYVVYVHKKKKCYGWQRALYIYWWCWQQEMITQWHVWRLCIYCIAFHQRPPFTWLKPPYAFFAQHILRFFAE